MHQNNYYIIITVPSLQSKPLYPGLQPFKHLPFSLSHIAFLPDREHPSSHRR